MTPVPGFDPASAQRRLEALAAAIQAFPPERQPAVLREYLVAELDRLEAMEDSHQAYLAECVLLAIDNMQDARLQAVEDRLAAIESPDGPSLAEILTEAALAFAISLVALAAVEAAGGAVLLWAGQAALAPVARQAVEDADRALLATAQQNVATLGALQARLEQQAAQTRGLTAVLEAMRGQSVPAALLQVGKALLSPIATARSIADALAKTFTVAADANAVQAQMLLSHVAMAEGVQTSVAARVAYEKALVGDAARPNAIWRKFLDDASGNVALTPAYSVFENAWKDVQATGLPAAAGHVGDPFLASTPAGRLLSLMHENRRAIRDEYAVLRAGLNYRDDGVLLTDPLVTQLTGLVAELAPLRSSYMALQDTVRPLIVRGYEAALWWAYLSSNGMLAEDEGVTYETYDATLEVGQIADGYVIRKAPPDIVPAPEDLSRPEPGPDSCRYDADYHPGLPLLAEERAEYLYSAFAEPYFRIPENVATLPFAYDPARYGGVRAMPKRIYGGLMANPDRARRLDELRLLVIVFFQRLPGLSDPTSSGLLSAMGKLRGTPPSAAAWMELNPPATPLPPPSNPLADGSAARAAEAAAPALSALLADTGVLSRTFYDAQRAKLDGAIAELRGDIAELQALDEGTLTAAQSTRGRDEEGYGQLVAAEQKQLLDLYDSVLTSAQFDQAEVTAVTKKYEELVIRLSTWKLAPTTTKAPGWRLVTPTP